MAENVLVHYDSASYASTFCDVLDQGGLVSANEDEITCPSCVARLQRMDMMIDRDRPVPVAQRIDWFGEG